MKIVSTLNKASLANGMLALIWLALLAACSNEDPRSPEAAVKATLAALEEAAEARTLSGFMQHLAKDYNDHEGRSWEDIQRMVQFQYLRNQSIHIYSDITELSVVGNTATVEINAAMAARASDLNLLDGRLRANTHSFSIVLTGSDNAQTWHVASVSWRRGWQ